MVMGNAQPLRSEHVPMMDSLDRVLAEDIYSDLNMPPFDKSAVDGFCRPYGRSRFDLESGGSYPCR